MATSENKKTTTSKKSTTKSPTKKETINKNATKQTTTVKTSTSTKNEKIKNENKKETVEVTTTTDTKVFKVLSYLGILWIVSLFVPCKDDKSVKFHAGQGMLLFIIEIGINIIWAIINNLVIKNIFRVEHTIFGYGTGQYYVSSIGIAISTIISLAISAVFIYFMVIGIINAIKDEDKELPFIGKYSFYK